MKRGELLYRKRYYPGNFTYIYQYYIQIDGIGLFGGNSRRSGALEGVVSFNQYEGENGAGGTNHLKGKAPLSRINVDLSGCRRRTMVYTRC